MALAHLQWQGALGASLFELGARGLNGLKLTRDDHLARAVVVGGDTHTGDGGANLLDLFVGHADDGGHRAGSGLASLLHSQGARLDQLQTLLKRQGTSGNKCAELAQRVAGNHIGLEFVAHGQRQDYTVQEHCRLRHLGLLQVVLGAFKHQVGDAETQHLIGLLKQLLGLGVVVIQIFTHAHKL